MTSGKSCVSRGRGNRPVGPEGYGRTLAIQLSDSHSVPVAGPHLFLYFHPRLGWVLHVISTTTSSKVPPHYRAQVFPAKHRTFAWSTTA